MRLLSIALLCLTGSHCALGQDSRPNILMIIADDLGYADLGVHGSMIRTPNIDALAEQGLLFTQFHAAPNCATARAMLYTGNNNYAAGLAVMGIYGGPVIPGLYGYENQIPTDRVATLSQLLNTAGYRNYIAGKWHLGNTLDASPYAIGFDRSFVMKSGAGAHFSNLGYLDTPAFKYFEDNTHTNFPDGAYSTELYTDKLIGWMEEDRDNDAPFFAVAAYTSPHWPLQVPDEDLDLYAGEYEMGYDELRRINFDNLQQAGIIPADTELPPRNPAITPWTDLSPEEQRRESRKMEMYASMVENMDRHIGRLLDYLRDRDLYDNTLIIFMSDNGAAAEDLYYVGPPRIVEYISTNYEDSTERIGLKGNFVSYGPQWAEAGAAPFRLFKGVPTQGGMVAPMIMAGPGVERRDEFTDAYFTIMDFMPTILDMVGARYPTDKTPMYGESAVAFLADEANSVHDDEYVTVFTGAQRSYLRQGDWKLLMLERPFNEANFELFNLRDDPGETNDLTAQNPEKRQAMIALWRDYRRRAGITLPQDL